MKDQTVTLGQKKMLFFLLLPFVIIVILSLFNYSQDPYKIFQNNFDIDDYLKKPKNISERELKFQLINKNNYTSYHLGSSSSSTLNFTEKENEFVNASFEGPKIDEIIDYLNFILKNKKPEKFFFELRYYMFTDFNFNPNKAYQLETNPLNKLYKLLDLHITKESFKKLMGIESFRYLFNEDLKLIDLKNVSNIFKERTKLGLRDYPKRPDKNKEFNEYLNRIELIKKKTIGLPYINEKINQQKVSKFISILNELEKKKIDYKIFFSPTTLKAQDHKNNLLKKQELELIKKLIENKNNLNIYYFNNKNEMTSNYHFFLDHFHYYYDLADMIKYDILSEDKKKLKYSILVNKENYLDLNLK